MVMMDKLNNSTAMATTILETETETEIETCTSIH